MKKVILIFTLVFLSALSYNQDIQYEYCQLIGKGNFITTTKTKVNISIDFGNGNYQPIEKAFPEDLIKLKDYDSMIDGLNYMSVKGWQFVQAFEYPQGNWITFYYLLRRPKIIL